MLAPLSVVPGCNCIEGPVSEPSVGKVCVVRWLGGAMRVLKLGWVLVVDVGLGVWELGSKSSVEEGSRGRVATRWRLVWVEAMVWVGDHECISLRVAR